MLAEIVKSNRHYRQCEKQSLLVQKDMAWVVYRSLRMRNILAWKQLQVFTKAGASEARTLASGVL